MTVIQPKIDIWRSFHLIVGKKRLLTLVYNLGDELLYEAFNQSWWSQEEMESSDLWQEVSNSAVNWHDFSSIAH